MPHIADLMTSFFTDRGEARQARLAFDVAAGERSAEQRERAIQRSWRGK